MIKAGDTTFRTVAGSCLHELSKIKASGRELWTGRLESFLQAIKSLESDRAFDGMSAMTLIDLDRLKYRAQESPDLAKYIRTLPSEISLSRVSQPVAHAQHLKMIAVIVPVIADFA
jgi:hypothetical protein